MDIKNAEQGTAEELQARALVLQAFREEPAQPMPNYPAVKDGGENLQWANMDHRSAEEKFAEWFACKTAVNPAVDDSGWITL